MSSLLFVIKIGKSSVYTVYGGDWIERLYYKVTASGDSGIATGIVNCIHFSAGDR